MELVTHGEHLRQAADSLERAPSTIQRELRAHTLAGTFRALANVGGGVLADRGAHFVVAAPGAPPPRRGGRAPCGRAPRRGTRPRSRPSSTPLPPRCARSRTRRRSCR